MRAAGRGCGRARCTARTRARAMRAAATRPAAAVTGVGERLPVRRTVGSCTVVSCVGLEPLTFIVHTWPFLLTTSFDPSGDHAGSCAFGQRARQIDVVRAVGVHRMDACRRRSGTGPRVGDPVAAGRPVRIVLDSAAAGDRRHVAAVRLHPVDLAVVEAEEGDVPTIRRPGRIAVRDTEPVRDPRDVAAIGVHHVDLRPGIAHAVGGKGDLGAVRRPAGRPVGTREVGEVDQPGAIRVHHVDLVVGARSTSAILVPSGDGRSGVALVLGVVRDLHVPRAVGLHHRCRRSSPAGCNRRSCH